MKVGRFLFGVGFVAAGITHFLAKPLFAAIVPPALPRPVLLVEISGVAEMLGGVGILLPFTRRAAAWGLAALLISVLPANIYMAVDHARWRPIPEWILWARLPLQVPLLLWAWSYTRPRLD